MRCCAHVGITGIVPNYQLSITVPPQKIISFKITIWLDIVICCSKIVLCQLCCHWIDSSIIYQAKKREAASLDRQVLLKKLRDVLDSLKGRVAGRNRDETEEAISLVRFLLPFYLLLILFHIQGK